MWVFTTIGFFSIVAHRDRRGFVLVRARDKADLSALVQRLPLPRPKVERTPNADYLFRVVVGKQAMARVLESLAEAIDYDSFKGAVAKAQGIPRAKIYHDVWAALLPLQQPKLALIKSKPKPKRKYDPKGGIVFGEVSAAEMEAIDRARAARVAKEKRASEQRIAAMHPGFVARNTSDGSDIDFEHDTTETDEPRPIETDAGMVPDTRPDDERLAELKARMDPLLFARMVDQAKGEGIVTGSSTDKFETVPKKRSKSTKENSDAGMVATAEDLAAGARLSARAARAARPEFKLSDYATEAEMLAALRARCGDAQFERFSCSDGIRVFTDESTHEKKT